MTNHQTQELLFSATITPNRSMTRRGYMLFMGFFVVYCFGLGLFFLALGWWPIFAFLGVDLIALWLAFRICYRRSRGYERIELTYESLSVKKVSPEGKEITWTFHPTWSRLAFQRGMEDGQLDKLVLMHKSDSVEIASALSHYERQEFFDAFKLALRPLSVFSSTEIPPHKTIFG